MPTTLGVEIPFGTPQHARVLQAIRDRYDFSYKKMQVRYPAWDKAEELYRAYVKPDDDVTARKAKRDQGSQQFVTINVPYSYAILLTAHTYWSSVFLGRDPVFQYTGRHGETQQRVQALEALIDYQLQVGEMLVPLYIWLLDAGKYGIGIVGNYWDEQEVVQTVIEETPVTFLGMPIPGKFQKARRTQRLRGYCGNKIYNIRPYDFFPDPRVSLLNFQQGEFCGRRTQIGWNEVLRRAQGGEYFNVEELQKSDNRVEERTQGSSQVDLPYGPSEAPFKGSLGGRGFLDLIEMVVELVPDEWGLTSSKFPEKWAFTMADRNVIIGCRPLGCSHNKFPFQIQSYEMDAYSFSIRGMLEVLQPLNDTLSWLVNSHYFNVRKSLNDQFIVDPSKVVMKDLTDGGPGKLIRLAPTAYGSDVRTVVSQLAVMDVTQQNLKDSQLIAELLQRASGVTDNVMGMVNAGGRKTATEVRSSTSFGINRLKTHAEFNSALGFAPLSQMLVQNTQQFYDQTQNFKVAGDLLGTAKFMPVTPEDILGFFDFVPVDGTMPIDRYAQANLWKDILFGLVKAPQIGMSYDLAGIFSWMAQLAGLKNITQFKVAVQPDAAVAAAVQAGNMVPAGAGPVQGSAGFPGDLGGRVQ